MLSPFSLGNDEAVLHSPHLEVSEPVHERLEDDALLADVEAPGQALPQVRVQDEEVALLHAAVEEGASTARVRR